MNTSEIIEYIIEYCNIELGQLLPLKEIYLKETKFLPNQNLIDKINRLIHSKGMELSSKGQMNNDTILSFIFKDEIYTNNNYKELKDFEILEGFNISLMDENFIQNYISKKIYELFENDLNKYLTIFSKKIRHAKFFGLFFKLLPSIKYNLDLINIILSWSEQKIKTYNKEECQNF